MAQSNRPSQPRVLVVSAQPGGILPGGIELHYAPTGHAARRLLASESFDTAVITMPLTDEDGKNLALELARDGNTCVILLCRDELCSTLARDVSSDGILVLPSSSVSQTLYPAFLFLQASHQRMRQLEKKASSLENKMEDIRIINRAKLLLVEKLHMKEDAAHRYIEQQAMNTCIKKRIVAERIIQTYEG